jgi:hypothetical protein
MWWGCVLLLITTGGVWSIDTLQPSTTGANADGRYCDMLSHVRRTMLDGITSSSSLLHGASSLRLATLGQAFRCACQRRPVAFSQVQPSIVRAFWTCGETEVMECDGQTASWTPGQWEELEIRLDNREDWATPLSPAWLYGTYHATSDVWSKHVYAVLVASNVGLTSAALRSHFVDSSRLIPVSIWTQLGREALLNVKQLLKADARAVLASAVRKSYSSGHSDGRDSANRGRKAERGRDIQDAFRRGYDQAKRDCKNEVVKTAEQASREAFQVGQKTGYTAGNKDGYASGQQDGYAYGVQDGYLSANQELEHQEKYPEGPPPPYEDTDSLPQASAPAEGV